MKIAVYALFLFSLTIAVPACAQAVGKNGTFEGYVVQGRKFGVDIGMDRMAARAALEGRSGTSYVNSQPCNENFAFDCPSGDEVDAFYVKKVFTGDVICLLVHDGRVAAIIWNFTLFGTVDL